MRPEIVVGLDGSPESLSAAHWAAREAQRRALALRLLHLWILPPMTGQQIVREDQQAAASERLLHEARHAMRQQYPGLQLINQVLPAHSPDALLSAAQDAELVVLGSQGLGTVSGYLLGSVALYAVAHADRPVVLVRTDVEPSGTRIPAAPPGGVAVGVSLRAGYDNTLDFAFDAARRRDAALLAVHATSRRRPVIAREHPPAESSPEVDRQALSAALLPWRAKYPDVHVVEHLSQESPARAVVDIAVGARLLVVGRGGYRSGPAPRIGSVAHAAIHHSVCPVAVIPHDPRD
ncbi:nucleotide-binding universal stress UspA family protein [Kitasatospora sp. GP30]|uniref:universal stress protein n=1 Tax=Kitasatospora sp. GP30 TaxID=3035084 RepID=UPI000CAF3706|nr:universal stress protein [Kitasatospora sp. GP30]MDH6143693.1 nucleotide-binding universal stress UspA family protein [Kitasatospora sp. GP30]